MAAPTEHKDYDRFHRALTLQSVLILAILWGGADLNQISVAGNRLSFADAMVLETALIIVLTYFAFRYRIASGERYGNRAGKHLKTLIGHQVRSRVEASLQKDAKEKIPLLPTIQDHIKELDRDRGHSRPHQMHVKDAGPMKSSGWLLRTVGPPTLYWSQGGGNAIHKGIQSDASITFGRVTVLAEYIRAWKKTVLEDATFWEDFVPWILGIWAWLWAVVAWFVIPNHGMLARLSSALPWIITRP